MAKTRKINNSDKNILLEHAFKQFHAPLYFYALKFVNSQDAAKDVVQDAFLSILNSKVVIEDLKSYLFRVVRNGCLNVLKNNETKNKYALKELERVKREIEFYDTHKTLVENEQQEILEKAIEELPDNYKKVLKLSRFEELKNKEIAEKLGVSVRTVETQIYRALKLLRKKFNDQSVSLFYFFSIKNKKP